MTWLLTVWLMTTPSGAGSPVDAVTNGAAVANVDESGVASFYARSFEGQKTASGELYRASVASCAHRSHPFGTRLRVTLVKSGRSAVCVVNDRGPFLKKRILDVSRSVAVELGLVRRGVGTVRIEVLPPV